MHLRSAFGWHRKRGSKKVWAAGFEFIKKAKLMDEVRQQLTKLLSDDLPIITRKHIELALASLKHEFFQPTLAGLGFPTGYYRIPGYSRYAINSSANVYSKRKRGILKPWPNSNSHPYLRLDMVDDDGRYRKPYIHDLMLATFAGEKPVGSVVRHKDDNPTNNALSNLEYGTATENMSDAIRNGRNPSKLSSETINEIVNRHFNGALRQDLVDEYGVSMRTINKIVSESMHKAHK